MLNSIVNRMFGGEPEAAVVNSDVGSQRKRGAGQRKSHFCQQLLAENERPHEAELKKLWKSLEDQMAVVPSGPVLLRDMEVSMEENSQGGDVVHTQQTMVESFYVDKTAVTNADFLQFVKAGCYEDMELWDQQIWPKVTQMTDRTGKPGPKYWEHGKPPRDKMEHPVVGINWYEAQAYARWVGKQLPSSAQWQRAATWHHAESKEGNATKFTWGGTYETQFANAWANGIGTTVPVTEFYSGATPNGTYQLIGNTWEWINGPFSIQSQSGQPNNDLYEIRGGAFDTYLDSQMTCQFRSGQPRSHRTSNLGFRCVIPVKQLHRPQ